VSREVAEQLLHLLRRLTGSAGAEFHPGQREAIDALVQGRHRVLVVQRTGWGKSAVYFIATRLLRAGGAGPTLLVSPLLALMRNQTEAAARLGLRAETVNSENRDEWDEIQDAIDRDEVDLLLISAQRLANRGFQRDVLPVVGRRSGLLVIDEAHCISDWGHDFNPDYRRIRRVLELLPRGVPVLACTATANDRVVADIEGQLGDDLVTVRGPLARGGLALHVLDLPSQAERLAWLAATLPRLPGSGIVYCLTVADTERVASWLRRHGIDAHAYSSATPADVRLRCEQALLDNDAKALIATSALGMGFDKPDLGFVVHFQSPGSPVHYYQQVGRAGRQLDRSLGVLLAGHEDEDIQDWFIKTAFPAKHHAEQVVALLERDGATLGLRQIEDAVNVRHSRLEAMLKTLEVEGAVERDGAGWRRTLQPWAYDEDRVARVTALRRHEQRVMRDYRSTQACRMEMLRRVLDDADAAPCGICDNCTGERLRLGLDPRLVQLAREHLRRAEVVLKPRQRYPSRAIPAEHRISSARSLARWGDGGWGGLVRRGKQVDGRFADDLVAAAGDLVARWSPDPAPAWVTCVPSLRHPGLVPDLAARLASRLGLPFHEALAKAEERPPQKEMENSSQQVRNVIGAFRVSAALPLQPVLFVDDVWDSGWTMTVIAEALAAAGVPAVHALTLATATGG
jgi:ATP-dependent DNA helicase RecQ